MPAVVVGKVVARSPSRETTREVLWLSTPTEIGMAAILVVVTDPGPGGSLLDTVSSDPFPVRASRDTTAGPPSSTYKQDVSTALDMTDVGINV